MIQCERRSGGSFYLVDSDLDDQKMAEARTDLAAGDFFTAEDLLSQRSRNVNEFSLCVEAVSDWRGRPEFLKSWAEESKSINAFRARAIQTVKYAWEARGGSTSVSRRAAEEFFRRLPLARKRLIAVIKRNRDEYATFPWLIWCARGLGDPVMSRDAFDEAIRREPRHRAVYSSELISRASRWYGNEEELFGFAEHYFESAPSGIGICTLVIEAHYYWWGDSGMASDYWRRKEVRRDVLKAHRRCTERDLQGMNGVRTAQWMGYALWKAGEKSLAGRYFEVAGAVGNCWPWGGRIFAWMNWLFNEYGHARRRCLASR